MKVEDAEAILDGCAFLECLGILYEYAGFEDGKFIFRSVYGNRRIKTSRENLLTMPEYNIHY